jgi:DNA-binding IclR family transcriptional regulator
LHRSIAYRLLRTLEDHQLVQRDAAGRFGLGLGVAALARGVRTGLQAAARPRLDEPVGQCSATSSAAGAETSRCSTPS